MVDNRPEAAEDPDPNQEAVRHRSVEVGILAVAASRILEGAGRRSPEGAGRRIPVGAARHNPVAAGILEDRRRTELAVLGRGS